MAASIAGRSTFLRTIWRTTTNSTSRFSASSSPSIRSNFVFRCTRISPPPSTSSRLLRRELSSLLPVHSAIASACLVTKLPNEASSSAEGRFANYISPI